MEPSTSILGATSSVVSLNAALLRYLHLHLPKVRSDIHYLFDRGMLLLLPEHQIVKDFLAKKSPAPEVSNLPVNQGIPLQYSP